jgi:hypothetical protein
MSARHFISALFASAMAAGCATTNALRNAASDESPAASPKEIALFCAVQAVQSVIGAPALVTSTDDGQRVEARTSTMAASILVPSFPSDYFSINSEIIDPDTGAIEGWFKGDINHEGRGRESSWRSKNSAQLGEVCRAANRTGERFNHCLAEPKRSPQFMKAMTAWEAVQKPRLLSTLDSDR